MKEKGYQGHKCRAYWSVALNLFNEYALYQHMRMVVRTSETLDRAAERLASELEGCQTTEGCRFSRSAIRAALENWEP